MVGCLTQMLNNTHAARPCTAAATRSSRNLGASGVKLNVQLVRCIIAMDVACGDQITGSLVSLVGFTVPIGPSHLTKRLFREAGQALLQL